MDNRLSKAARTRQFIIEATAPIFNIKGYAGTSMADLTEATKLTKGSIYGNFRNKEEVALAAFDYNLGKMTQMIAQQLQKAVSYQDKLMVYARVYHNFMGAPFPAGGCPILNTAIESDDTHPALKEKAAKAVNEWKNSLAWTIDSGRKAGEFKAGADSTQLALSIIALIEGGMMIAKVTDNTENMDRVLAAAESLILELSASKQTIKKPLGNA